MCEYRREASHSYVMKGRKEMTVGIWTISEMDGLLLFSYQICGCWLFICLPTNMPSTSLGLLLVDD